jgi:Na+/H+ antiporter NhaD/arsenite permease-like protein
LLLTIRAMHRLLWLLLLGLPLTAAEHTSPPAVWLVVPFIVLLTAIAVMPLLAAKFWHHRYPQVSFALGGVVAIYYLFSGHANAVVHVGFEYMSFISVISCLFLVTAGIVLNLGFAGNPRTNLGVLLFGAVLANAIGTTGASILLIRPFLRMNRGRLRPYHLVFFIFMVANIGGALTPIGDPPLMLGYLKGIEFVRFYELNLPAWLLALALLGGIFYVIDWCNKTPSQAPEPGGEVVLTGVKNILLLAISVGCILIDPNRVQWVPGLTHGPAGWGLCMGKPPSPDIETFSFVREILLLSIGWFALRTTPREHLQKNGFTSEPLREVAILFVGIFLTMMPALELIRAQAVSGALFGIPLTPMAYYFGTGVFSGILDNAPTFMAFMAGMEGQHDLTIAQIGASTDPAVVRAFGACAVASVFWGAMSYIGNGPNFMVKAIVESTTGPEGRPVMEVPSFFGYIGKYALPILLPVLFVVGILLYR